MQWPFDYQIDVLGEKDTDRRPVAGFLWLGEALKNWEENHSHAGWRTVYPKSPAVLTQIKPGPSVEILCNKPYAERNPGIICPINYCLTEFPKETYSTIYHIFHFMPEVAGEFEKGVAVAAAEFIADNWHLDIAAAPEDAKGNIYNGLIGCDVVTFERHPTLREVLRLEYSIIRVKKEAFKMTKIDGQNRQQRARNH